MLKIIMRRASMIFSFVIIFSFMIFQTERVNLAERFNGFFLDNEYKLKFVDSGQYELGLSSMYKIIMPVEILSSEEESGGWIRLETYENAIVYTPIDAKVIDISDSGVMQLEASKIKVLIKNLLSGKTIGQKLECGEVIGSVQGSNLFVQVYWGERRLSLSEIREMI